MRPIAAALLASVVLPLPAAAAPFAQSGSVVVGGHLDYRSESYESGDLVSDASALAFGPTVSAFLWDHVALRFSPVISLAEEELRETGPNGPEGPGDVVLRSQHAHTYGIGVGPAIYLPVGANTHVTAGADIGVFTGSVRNPVVDRCVSGFRLGAEAGLAFLVGGTGLIEVLASWDREEATVHDSKIEWTESGLGLGIRLGIAL